MLKLTSTFFFQPLKEAAAGNVDEKMGGREKAGSSFEWEAY